MSPSVFRIRVCKPFFLSVISSTTWCATPRGRTSNSKGPLSLFPWLPKGRVTPMTPLWLRHVHDSISHRTPPLYSPPPCPSNPKDCHQLIYRHGPVA
ncbi:hypothetical protein GBA52_020173 [Prunus armeniaca]|nr:hypothetical protein GBA52_020173 [Prunus armeniaca]